MGMRLLKSQIDTLLASGELPRILAEVRAYPARQIINPLLGKLCSRRELEKWLAVSAIGEVMAGLADQELEAARVVIRRLMWTLNDESGGIGWGAPEAMGEALARHPLLAEEYTHILVTYMREDGNYLELEPLQRGLLWGVGRLAQVQPGLLRARGAAGYLLPYLASADVGVRGLAARAAGFLQAGEARGELLRLAADHDGFTLYDGEGLRTVTVAEVAGQALARLV